MKKSLAILALSVCALAATLTAQQAQADEVWATEQDDVIYQEDRNRTAIWSYGEDGTIFIDGLAGVHVNRGAYHGYWVQTSSSLRCDTYREDAKGEPTYYWGRFEIDFIDADFPSRWRARFGLCDQAATIPLNGTPLTLNTDS